MKNAEYAPAYLLCRVLEKCDAEVAEFVAENIKTVEAELKCLYLYIEDRMKAEVFHRDYESRLVEATAKTIGQYDVVVLDDKGYLKRKIGEAIDCIKITPKALKATEKLMSVNLMAWEILELAWETILKSRACLMDVSSPCFSWVDEAALNQINESREMADTILKMVTIQSAEEDMQLREIKGFLLESAELIETIRELKIRLKE